MTTMHYNLDYQTRLSLVRALQSQLSTSNPAWVEMERQALELEQRIATFGGDAYPPSQPANQVVTLQTVSLTSQ